MKEYTLTSPEVFWVALCLKDLQHHTLDEITAEYNRQHPPSRFFPRPHLAVWIKSLLQLLLKEGKVRAEVLTFYEEPIPATKFFLLTPAGIDYISRRR